MDTLEAKGGTHDFSAAEIGAIAHLYRGEVYRSTVWRTRLDNTTNWAVAGLGLALSASFSHADASPLPLLLIGILIVVFLFFEARRYRYFNVWRARARYIETNFYAPMLLGKGCTYGDGWEDVLAQDYIAPQYEKKFFYAPMLLGKGCTYGSGWEDVLAQDYIAPQYHISLARAIGRRLRRNYCYVLAIQALAYAGKIMIHPTAVTSFGEFVQRAAIGPIPGEVVLTAGLLFNAAWIIFALITYRLDATAHGARPVTMG